MVHPGPAGPARPRRRWLIFLPLIVVVVLAIGWTGFWFFAASRAETAMDAWRAREARSGRVHSCGTQTIGGFPFRIEVRCANAVTEITSASPPLVLTTAEGHGAVQIYQPTLSIIELAGPMSIAEKGQPTGFVANWKLAQMSVRGTPRAPERLSIALDAPLLERVAAGGNVAMVKAQHAELHGRLAAGTPTENPIIEVVLRLTAGSAPGINPLADQPTDADVAFVLRGLKDFAPKPWSARFREIQANRGNIEIAKARVQQGEVIATGAGTLTLSPRGALDGHVNLTIANIEKLLPALGLDRLAQQQRRIGSAMSALDRIAPGLGQFAAGPGIAAGLRMIGQPATLEGKPAVAVPLRFVDGMAFLGPLPLGMTPPLY